MTVSGAPRRDPDGDHRRSFLGPADGADSLGYATRVVGPSNEKPGAGSDGSGRKILTRRRVVSALLVLVLAAIAAAGGWLLGRGSGADLDAARAAGEKAGWKQGTAIGGDVYPAGLQTGRQITYPRNYRASYRTAYVNAFKGSDVKVPKAEQIKVSLP
jgi:hypothetical protein